MLLKVVCQLCGKTKTVNTDESIENFPRWQSYKLKDLYGDAGPYANYEVWICENCHRLVSTFRGMSRDERGEYYEDWDIDYEKLAELVRISLEPDEV